MRSCVRTGLVWIVLTGIASLTWGDELQPRIIGGEPVFGDEGHFFATLMSPNQWNNELWEPVCGASYIGDGLIMTAAHCIGNSELKILLGDPGNRMGYLSADCGQSGCSYSASKPGSGDAYSALNPFFNNDMKSINVTSQGRDILIHKKYSFETNANDIALIRLGQVPNESEVSAVKLPNSDEFSTFPNSIDVTVLGLGDTTYGGDYVASSELMKLVIPAVSASDCANQYSNYDDESMICAGYVNGIDGGDRKDSCQGDSGGPLFRTQGIDTTQYGIVSFGFLCAETYGVYSNVYGLKYWIDNVKAYWLDSIDFDWSVDFGTAENPMSKTINWTISNHSVGSIAIGEFDYNNLPEGFSSGVNQCRSTNLDSGQSCSVSFDANFNSVGTYEGEVYFDVNNKEYELKFDAAVVKPSSTSNRFSGGGSFSPWWLLLAAPLVLLRRTRKGPLALVLLSTLGLAACSSNPFASEPPEVVFNPSITEQGLEFSVMSNGCTQENHLLLRIKGDEVEVVRTQPDMCRATPHLKRFVMPLPKQETVWQLENPVRYSNRVTRNPG